MYNGIGLTTPRGSGTNGYVQRNLANVNSKKCDDFHPPDSKSQSIFKKPNKDILEHERKRKIELKCVELEDLMEKQGYKIEEIEEKVNLYRESLMEKHNELKKIDCDVSMNELLKDSGGRIKGKGTHEESLANALKDQKFKEALNITSEDEKNTNAIFDKSSKRKLAEVDKADESDEDKPRKKKSKKIKRSKKKKSKKNLDVSSSSDDDEESVNRKHKKKTRKHKRKNGKREKGSRRRNKSEDSKESGQISESMSSRRNSQEKRDELKRIMDDKMKQAWKDDNININEEDTLRDRSFKNIDSSMEGGRKLEKVIRGKVRIPHERQKYGESKLDDGSRREEGKDHTRERRERDVPRSNERESRNDKDRRDKFDVASDARRDSRRDMSHKENEDRRYVHVERESRREWRDGGRRDDRYRGLDERYRPQDPRRRGDRVRREEERDYHHRSPNVFRRDGRMREEVNDSRVSKDERSRDRVAEGRGQPHAYRDYEVSKKRVDEDRPRRGGRPVSNDDRGARHVDTLGERRDHRELTSIGRLDLEKTELTKTAERNGQEGLLDKRSSRDQEVVRDDFVKVKSVVIADKKKDDVERKMADVSSSSSNSSVSSVSSSDSDSSSDTTAGSH